MIIKWALSLLVTIAASHVTAVVGQDIHCGSRCVQRILVYYDCTNASLLDIVADIHAPVIDKPARLDRIVDFLNRSHIHTRTIKIRFAKDIVWPYPVIIHATNPDGQPHYIARIPPERNNWEETISSPTGIYLLTSPHPIKDTDISSAVCRSFNLTWIALVVTISLLGIRIYRHIRSAAAPSQSSQLLAICLMFLVPLFALPANTQADEKSSHSKKSQECEFVLSAMQLQRQKLVSGIFEARGTITLARPELGSLGATVHLYCAFDHATARLRFDRKQIDNSHALYSAVEYSKTPDVLTVGTARSPILSLQAPHKDVQTGMRPFDIRSFGLATWRDLERGTALDEILASYVRPKSKSMTLERSGLYVYENLGTLRRQVWIDPTKDYWPVKSLVRQFRNGELEIIATSEISLERRGEIWVPVSYQLQEAGNTLKYDLTWKNTNEEIQESLFDYDTFALDKYKRIVDFRLGTPVVIRDLEIERKFLKNKRHGWATVCVVAISALFVCVLVAWRRHVFASGDS